MSTLAERKAVLKKVYGGERTAMMHKFDVDTGICVYCQTFIGDINGKRGALMCNVITPDEVAKFRYVE